jgi:hypothetical protein
MPSFGRYWRKRGKKMKRKEILERIVSEYKAYRQKLQEEEKQGGRDALAILDEHAGEFADKKHFAALAELDMQLDEEDVPPAIRYYCDEVVYFLSLLAEEDESNLLEYLCVRYARVDCSLPEFVSNNECFWDGEGL